MRSFVLGILLVCVALVQASAAAELMRVGNGPEPETLDPQRSRSVSSGNIVRDLYEGLVRYAPDGGIVGAAAARWELFDDSQAYRFEIRADARWCNGDPVLAADFVAGLRRALTPSTGAPYVQMLIPIAGASEVLAGAPGADVLKVQAVAPRTLEIRLKHAAPEFLAVLAHPVAFPVHAGHAALESDAIEVTSNGAYCLQHWRPQAEVSLRRNPHYWNADAVDIEQVVYVPTEDSDAEYRRFRAGQLDVTSEVPTVLADEVRKMYPQALRVAPYLGVYYYGINLTRAPFEHQGGLRQALSMVIDRRTIAERVLGGLALPAWSWVPPGVRGYTSQRPEWARWPYEQRVARARELYRAAGYSSANPLETEIRYNTHDGHKRVATVVAAMWKQTLGIRTRLVNEEFKVFIQRRREREQTQVFRASWIADYDDPFSFMDVLHGGLNPNDSGWMSEAYNAAVDAAHAVPDSRVASLQEAERILLDEVPVIPLYLYVSKHLVAPRVQGWADNVLDYHYSQDLSLQPAEAVTVDEQR